MSATAEKLMDLAEGHIRQGGYAGFSFREIAAEMGIKSASVHHHFATKATMTAAIARRYGERFFEGVKREPSETAERAIAIYRSAFRRAIERDGCMCLFGVLGAEVGALDSEVSAEILSFFRRCIADLSQRIGGPNASAQAFHVMASLEGGMMLSRIYGNIDAFDQATASLCEADTRPDRAAS